jgi:FMN phosphatase YigB (HAD superfamily)
MIGNSIHEDILGAKAIGMKTVLYRSFWQKYTRAEEKHADFMIDDLNELLDIV